MGELKYDKVWEVKEKLNLNFYGGEGAWKTEEVMVMQAEGRYLSEDVLSGESVGDIKEGELLYKRGHRVRPQDIAVLASVGKTMLKVFMKPIVSILSIGKNLVSVIDVPEKGQSRDVNSFVLASLAERTGAQKGQIFLVNEVDRLKEYLSFAVNRSDVVLVASGNEAGDKECILEAIEALGKPGVISHGLAMEPGSETVIGITKDATCHCENRMPALTIAFNGDSAAMMIAYEIIADYFIKSYYFHSCPGERYIEAVAGKDFAVSERGNREETFALVSIEESEDLGYVAVPVEPGLSGVRDFDGFTRVAGEKGIVKGERIKVRIFA
ncbi:MAG: molybdopterin-binding protein [Anaerovoracaceae bacterium]|jgi:molybdopterin molybdotransferase